MGFIIFVYTALIVFFIIKGQYFISAMIIATIPFVFIAKKMIKQARIQSFAKSIAYAREAYLRGEIIKPFLNVNKEPLYIIELIPGITKNAALKIMNKRNEGFGIPNMDHFIMLTGLKEQFHEIAHRILMF